MERRVYFARAEHTGLIKIGESACLEQRLRKLAVRRRAQSVILLASIPGNRELEGGFHRLFWHLHEGNEWFRPEAELLKVIANIEAGAFDVGSVPTGPSPIRTRSAQQTWAKRRAALEPHQDAA